MSLSPNAGNFHFREIPKIPAIIVCIRHMRVRLRFYTLGTFRKALSYRGIVPRGELVSLSFGVVLSFARGHAPLSKHVKTVWVLV